MSELNNTIKPWLLANGFKEVNDLPKEVSDYTWDYVYTDNKLYIYFDATDEEVCAGFCNGYKHKSLHIADVEQVIAYFTEHGKAPVEKTKELAPNNSTQHIQQRDIPYTRKDVAAKLNSMGYNQCNWTTRTLQVKDKQGNMLGVAYSHMPNFEAVIEAMIGEKLELRKPKFGAEEAVKMLLDDGWQNDEHSIAEKGYFTLNTNEDMLSIYIAKKRANIQISALELNEHNIGVVIKIAQLSKQFKSSSND